MLRVLAGVALLLHGLIHLIGFVVPLQLVEVDGFPYRTTMLGGAVDLGVAGASAVGLLWLFLAIEFVVAAVGLLVRATWAVPLTVGLAGVSLVICLVALPETAAGALVNVATLAVFGLRGVAVRRTHPQTHATA